MEHIIENPFLGKEQSYIDYFAEFDKNINKKQQKLLEQAEEEDDANEHAKQLKTIESFVQEKDVLIASVKEYVIFLQTARSVVPYAKPSQQEQDHLKALSFRIMRIIEKYQEQSALLDAIMEHLVSPSMTEIRTICNSGVLYDHEKGILQFIYTLCKVRGHKNVTKWLPHEVCDVEPCFEMLCKLNPDDASEWYLSYVLQVWLSILIIVPFDIDTIDSKSHLIDRIIAYIMKCLEGHGKCREGASLLLSKFITRPDIVKKGYLGKLITLLNDEYVKYCKIDNKAYYLIGILDSAASILKHGQRKELLIEIKPLMKLFENIKNDEIKHTNVLIRKAKAQYSQRLGMALLPSRVAPWRYKLGSKSLSITLQGMSVTAEAEMQKTQEDVLSEDVDIGSVEEVIGYLLQQLADKDTIVRWSISKGIGRITGRLTMQMADEIISNIMSLMTDSETDNTWHGCCLSIAELCRRGLLLPNRLNQLTPLLEKALLYDINKGNYSVGQNVRDAACYVAWTFARAYSVDIMKSYVSELSKNLMIVALTDKETNCRRAASAAFQEHVGRQGSFPHGIEILTEADYFTLSSIMNSYLRVIPFVGQFDDYYEHLMWHLVNIKLSYFLPNIRSMASKAIGMLTPLKPKFVVEKILPILCKQCENKVLNYRHGAVLGVAEILLALCGKSGREKEQISKEIISSYSEKNRKLLTETKERKQFDEMFNKLQVMNNVALLSLLDHTSVLNIIPVLEEKKLFRGIGGEIMRNSICLLIEAICESKIPLNSNYLKSIHLHLEETLKHPNIDTQRNGANALESLYSLTQIASHPQYNTMVDGIVKNALDNPSIEISRGYTMALGSYTKESFIKYNIMSSILKNCTIKKTQNDEPETRREALLALKKQLTKYTITALTLDQTKIIESTIFKSFKDYTTDRRGDIGSIVREAAMDIGQFYFMSPNIADTSVLEYVCCLLKQCAEKIDSVRHYAANTLMKFIRKTKAALPQLEVLLSATEPVEKDAKTLEPFLNWREPTIVFPCLQKLLGIRPYNESVLEGWVLSSGGITESTVKASTSCLLQYIYQSKDAAILSHFANMLDKHYKIERITLPVITTLEQIFNANYYTGPEHTRTCQQIVNFLDNTTKNCKSVNRLCKASGLLCSLYTRKELRKQIAPILVCMLFNREFPKLRKETAEKLYMAVLTEDNELLLPLLSDTNWTDDVECFIANKDILTEAL